MQTMRVRAAILAVAAWAVLASAGASAQQPAPQPAPRDTHELLNATLWIQTSAEHWAACRSTYGAATRALDAALADPGWTAALEQTGSFGSLPPAVIVDLDETILDNSPFAGRLVSDRIPFDPKVWAQWVARADAAALPGSLDFIRHAQGRGVTVFYVTNRSADQEEATRANLSRLGIALPADTDTVLMSRERPEWRSDKSSRRAFVAARYRVLLLVGDDLGDFVSGAAGTPENRVALAERYADYWGTRWFVIPNPMNGSWETAVYGNEFPPDREVLQRKLAKVKSFR